MGLKECVCFGRGVRRSKIDAADASSVAHVADAASVGTVTEQENATWSKDHQEFAIVSSPATRTERDFGRDSPIAVSRQPYHTVER